MYGQHFGLESSPFRITPDTRRFYPGAQRGAVLDALAYAILRGEGIVKLTGEVGSGKTMLCRMLADRLAPDVDIVYLANPSLRREDVLQAIALDLKLPTEGGRLQVLQVLHDYLLQRHTEGRRVAVFVEEAQGMDLEALEEIRLLSNLETREDKLLQIVLFGQPELDTHLAVHEVRQLRDRITHSFSLSPLSLAEVRDYIPFRLRAAGYLGGDPFTWPAYWSLARASSGLIRRIHILADKALLAAYADGSRQVRFRHMRRAVADSEFAAKWSALPRPGWGFTTGILILAAIGTTGLAMLPQAGVSAMNAPSISRHADRPEPPASLALMDPGQASSGAAEITKTAYPSTFSARVAATRSWLSSDFVGRYTIQIMTSDSAAPAPLERYLMEPARQAHHDHLYIVPVDIDGTQRWSVLYGIYDSYAAAQLALQEIPAALKGNGPYLRSLTAVKKEASGYWLPARQDT
ncbi:MAG: AAA family ATPase [Gammaproteobacteria bacterium]|nr:AAA family ATPase [Gammaproteobacteria bacterium]MCW9059358.1 AAA family ATPase [Gammaproteobacteria bacterium]